MKLLAFGGPLNEQVVYVPNELSAVTVAVPQRVLSMEDGPMPEVSDAPRFGTYAVEKVGWHDWYGRCLVYEGYPRHRIIDALNAIAALARLADNPAPTKETQ